MRFLIIFIFLMSNSFANEDTDIKNLFINKELKKYDDLTFLDDKNKQLNLNMLPRETRKYIIAFHHLNRIIKFNYKNQYLNKFPNKPYLEIIKQQNLKNYLSSNKLDTLDGKVLTHINGFDVMDKSFSQTEILVPTKLFTNYFSIESISFKRTITKRKVNGCSQKYYRARYKDSLISISRKYNIKMDNLKEMNKGIRFVRPGMQIRLCN